MFVFSSLQLSHISRVRVHQIFFQNVGLHGRQKRTFCSVFSAIVFAAQKSMNRYSEGTQAVTNDDSGERSRTFSCTKAHE